LLEKIGGLGVLVEVAGLVLLNPDPDQVPANVVSFSEPVKRLAGQEFLSDLALEFDAVRAVCPTPFNRATAVWRLSIG
jgi:hypothetical protein